MIKISCKKLLKTIKFIPFTQEDFLATLGKNQNDINNLFFLKRWTHMAFARFEAFKFLDECESIIYLDFDVLLLKSIDELSKLRARKYHFGARLGKTLLLENLPTKKRISSKTYVFNRNFSLYRSYTKSFKMLSVYI